MGPFRLERGARCEFAVMGGQVISGVIHDMIHNVAQNRTTVIFRPDNQVEEMDCAKGPIFDKVESPAERPAEDTNYVGDCNGGKYYAGLNAAQEPSELYSKSRGEPSVMNAQLLMKRIVHLEQRLTEKEKLGGEIVALMDKLEAGIKADFETRKELGSKLQEMRYEHAMRIRRTEENIRTLFDALSDCRNVLEEIGQDVKKRLPNTQKRRATDRKRK